MKQRTYRMIAGCLLLGGALWVGRHWVLGTVFGQRGAAGGVASAEGVISFGFDGAVQGDGVPSPWQARVIRGTLQVQAVEGQLSSSNDKVLRVRSERSHFIVWYEARPFDPKEYPILTWTWKATVLPTDGDIRTHDKFIASTANRNDKAVQVLVGFEGDNVLSYVWDTTAPVGTEVEEWSPVATVKTRVVESGPQHLNEWREQRINIYEDYQRRYGRPPGKVVGVSVQTNSNHTASVGEGMVGPISARTH